MAFKKYPDIERLGHEDNKDIFLSGEDTLVIEEKVDGGNGSFWLEGEGDVKELHLGSRNRDLSVTIDEYDILKLNNDSLSAQELIEVCDDNN